MVYQQLEKYPDPNAHIDCACGFSGSIRFYEAPVGVVGRCFGCDTVYIRGMQEDGTETIKLAPGHTEKVKPMAGIPEFKDFKDMKKFLDKATAGQVPDATGNLKKPRSKKRKPAEKDPSNNLIETKPEVPIFKTIHYYLRPGDSWPELLKDGRQEVEMGVGGGVIVFCHQHLHGADCVDTCRSMN
jgi:hypothetical protein